MCSFVDIFRQHYCNGIKRGQTIKINTLKERRLAFSIDEFGFGAES